MLREMSRLEIETTIITEQVVIEAQLPAPTAFKTNDPNEFITSITCPNVVTNITLYLFKV